MHLLTEKTVTINRPVSAVFAYVTDMEQFGEWFPGVLAIESCNGLDHGRKGKEYLETVSVPFRQTRKIRLVVREVRTNRFFTTEGKFRPLIPRMEISLSEAAPGSCELAWRMFSRNNNVIVRHVLLPLARRLIGKRAEAGVASLKKKLEDERILPVNGTE